nr:tetratricopeptide repeat protein [uncultured Flavobacterium sp.]
MRKISLILLSLAITTGCKKEETTTETVAQDTLAPIETTSATTGKDSTVLFVAQIVKNKQEALALLKGVSAEKANEIYDKLFASDMEALGAINNFEGSFLETAHATDDASVAKKLKALENKIQPADLEIWDIGEGMVVVRTVADYYKNIFSGKVTADYDEAISIVADEEKELWESDAAVSIPWKDLGERVVTWENFIKKYPESKFRKEAEGTYKMYRHAFLLGLDNTQVIEITNNQMDTEARKAFTEFVKKYPDSETTTYVKMLLEDVNNKDKVAEVVRTDF